MVGIHHSSPRIDEALVERIGECHDNVGLDLGEPPGPLEILLELLA